MWKIFFTTIILALALLSNIPLAAAGNEPASRYFHSGDGKIDISSKKTSFSGAYRNADGSYSDESLTKINRVFGINVPFPTRQISVRFIEFIDFLSDHFGPNAKITVESGFRDPEYNTKLRERGKLAAKASLHQYGMAADLKFAGVSSKEVWDFVKELKFGGAGFYHGALVHVDVGPPRYWDETTSGVGTDISDDNKRIAVVTDKDIYLAGEEVSLKFTAMTAFPIGVNPKFTLEMKTKKGEWKKAGALELSPQTAGGSVCPKFSKIEAMADFRFTLPASIKPGRWRILAKFCENEWDKMPAEIFTSEFEVR